jgi:hypothetical protein
MRFRNWLKESTVGNNEEPDPTIDYVQVNHDPNQTRTYMPDDEYMPGGALATSDRDLIRLADALRELDPAIPGAQQWQPEIRNPDGSVSSDAFAGTVDYASPEQAQASRYHQMDNYQAALVKNLPKLFPELGREAMNLAALWNTFRSSVLRLLNVQEAVQTQPMGLATGMNPIHYALPLTQLQGASNVFQQIRRVLSSSGPSVQPLVPLFSKLYRAHMQLMTKIEAPLQRELQAARSRPFV